jgi:hypothetical protein
MSRTLVFCHVHVDFGFAFSVTKGFLRLMGDAQAAGSCMIIKIPICASMKGSLLSNYLVLVV